MTPSLQHWQPLSRSDRYVRRASLRLPAGVSEHRATFLVEESLRLMSLPGEDQGRTYYFRRVALRGLPASAPASEWIDRTQSTMHDLAARAVHGTDSRAAASDAVFFNSQQEALEWLLRRFFRASPNSADWFVPMIAPAAVSSDRTMQVVAVIESLRSLPAGWFAAASVVLDALESDAAAWPVLEAIPESFVRAWLSELGGASSSAGQAPRISGRLRRMLFKLLALRISPVFHPGPDDASLAASVEFAAQRAPRREPPLHLVWLAALAVVAEHPGELARAAATAHARAVLEELAESLAGASLKDLRDLHEPPSLGEPQAVRASSDSQQKTVPSESETVSGRVNDAGDREDLAPDAEPDIDPSLSTEAGGLYFFLNALRYLGIELAVEALPAPLSRIFLLDLIESLALAASVSRDDPALFWVAAELDAASPEDAFACMISAAECWPRAFYTAPDNQVTPHRLIRVWTLAVRRWCWHSARLTLRDIVSRPARILLTRTDLDVTLPMDTVDLRLRRIGLDLDSGWLPWFGRVVRFHYVHEPSRHSLEGGASA